MGVILNFDATQVDPRQSKGGVCFPLAEYPLEITAIDAVAVKDQPTKGFLEISLTVLDGQYKGQVQIDRLNLYGNTETAMRIAYQRLSAYAHIAGKLRVADSNELLGTKLIALIGPQDAPNEKYSDVKQVKDLAGNVPVLGQVSAPQNTPYQTQQPAQTQQQPQQPANPFGAATPAATAPPNPFSSPAAPAGGGFGTAAPAGNQPPWVK